MERTSKILGIFFIGGGVIKNQTSGFTFRGEGGYDGSVNLSIRVRSQSLGFTFREGGGGKERVAAWFICHAVGVMSQASGQG